MIRILIALVLVAESAFSASVWYVDPLAAGSNNGTSWVNAWTNPLAVNWASFSAGDTLYVSGGSSTQIYTNNLIPDSSKNGTLANPIYIKHSPDAGHNGICIFTNCTVGPNNASYGYVFDGGIDPNFAAPTNNQQVVSGTTCVTNNCGFWIQNLYGTNDSDTSPVAWYFTGGDNMTIQWIHVSGTSNSWAMTHPSTDWRGSVCYFNFPGSFQTNIHFKYLWLENNVSQGFGGGTPLDSAKDSYEIAFSWIYNTSEDMIEEGGGWSIHDSVLGPARGLTGTFHEDHFQFTGSNIRVYNNVIYPGENSLFRFQTWPEYTNTDVWVYNNIIPEIAGHTIDGGTWNEPVTWVHFDPAHPGTNGGYKRFMYANNTTYNTMTNTVLGVLPNNPHLGWSRGALTNSWVLDSIIVNNIWVNKHKGLALAVTTNVSPVNGYIVTSNSLILDFNVLAANNTDLTTPTNVSYIDYSGPSWGPYLAHNNAIYPSWVSKDTGNYELLPNDTAALNKGTNLQTLFNYDNLNRPRNVSGTWDIGALELQDTNLICWLTFDTSFTNWPDGRIDDQSGYGNHAYRWGNTNSVYPTNFPVAVYATNTAGANTNGYIAGDFRWVTNNYGIYGRWGQFAAITNVSMFTNVANFSVMCWAHYANATRINPVYDYSVDANAALISAGTSAGIVGSWEMGRYNQNIWLNNTRFQLMTNGAFTGSWGANSDPVYGGDGKVIFNFPDNGFNNNGDSAAWHHYAFTFANGVAKSYYDGTNLATCDVSAVTTHMTVGWNNYLTATTAMIGIGCDTHGGDALLAPWDNFYAGNTNLIAYPNNGWMDGQIDDVRIYNRTLTASEIAIIYSGVGNGGGGGGGGGSVTNKAFVTKLRSGHSEIRH